MILFQFWLFDQILEHTKMTSKEGTQQHYNHNLLLIHQIKHVLSVEPNTILELPTIRTIGLLSNYDPTARTATIEDQSTNNEGDDLQTTKFMIDLSLIPQFHAQIHSWYTFLGTLEKKYQLVEEMDNNNKHQNKKQEVVYFLRAKIAQEMKLRDGNSVKLWKRALLARQKFLSE